MLRWHMRKRTLPSYIRHDFRLKIFSLLTFHLSVLLSVTLAFERLLAAINENEHAVWMMATRTTCPKPSEVYSELSIGGVLLRITFMLFLGVGCLYAVVAMVCECFDIQWWCSLKGHYVMTSVIASNTMLTCVSLFHGFHTWQFKDTLILGSPAATSFVQTLGILWASIAIATLAFLALSFRAQGQADKMLAFHELQSGRGFKMWGITVFSCSLSDAPALVLLLSWFSVVFLLSCSHWVSVASFCILFLFLIDADQLLHQNNLDDLKRIVVLLHSKLGVFLAYYLLSAFFAFLFGDSGWATAITDVARLPIAFQLSMAIRYTIFNVWPGPPQGENMLKAIEVVLNEVRSQARNRVHPDPVGLPDEPDIEEGEEHAIDV